MRRLLLIVILALAVPASAAAQGHHSCRDAYLHPGDDGRCVKAASWLLRGQSPMRDNFRRLHYFHVRHSGATSHYGRKMRWATRTMKYRLGYKNSEVTGVWGPNVWAYVVGSKLRPIDMRDRAGNRYARFLRAVTNAKRRSARPHGGIAKGLSIARTAIADNYADGGRYYYTQGGDRSSFYYGVELWRHRSSHSQGGDCSASLLGIEHLAGIPATGGTYFGYTGSIAPRGGSFVPHGHVVWRRGWSLSLLRPGDLIVYGGGWPFDHVTWYLGAGRVYTFGSTTCPCNQPVFYRFDAALAVRPS